MATETKRALIVGASRGLGLGLAREFASRGYEVTATARDLAKATGLLELPAPARLETVDIDDAAAVDALVRRLEGQRFDVVFINAGVYGPQHGSADSATTEEVGRLFATNATSPIRLARKLVREAHALRRQAERWTRSKPEPGAKQNLRAEAGRLLGDARRLESHAVERALDRSPILCATLTGIDAALLGRPPRGNVARLLGGHDRPALALDDRAHGLVRQLHARKPLEVTGWIVPVLLERRGVTYLDVTWVSAVTGAALFSRRLALTRAESADQRFPWEPVPQD